MSIHRLLLAMLLILGLILPPFAVKAEEEGSHGSRHPHHEGSPGAHSHGAAGCCPGEKPAQKKEQQAEKSPGATNGVTGQAPGLAGDDKGEEEGSH